VRPLHISHSDGLGGADIAAYRIHRAVLAQCESRMAVAVRTTDDPTVVQLPQSSTGARPWMREHLTDLALHLQKSSNPVHRSANLVPSGALDFVNNSGASVVHLHWMGSDTMSITEIGGISVPTVWTLHDSWAFTGAEHHPEDADDRRYASGYTRSSRRPGNSRYDLDAAVFYRKLRHWRQMFWLAAPSRFMADLASRSTLAAAWPCRVIPNPLDTDVFRLAGDASRSALRSSWNIPQGAPVILFGASPGSDRNKGTDLLAAALSAVAARIPGAHAVVFGADAPPMPFPLPTHWAGRVDSPEDLAAVYSAADVMVVPSRMESFSQTASEAQACGTPVVAFATSGLLDVVEDGVSGLLVEPYDTTALGTAISSLLQDAGLRTRLGRQARDRAVRLWSMPVVAAQYLDWYAEAEAGQRESSSDQRMA
jgi:glycosyltransferase involved in cell wall biosynthesis